MMLCKDNKFMMRSMLCKEEDFTSEWYLRWRRLIADGAPDLDPLRHDVWGKVWEGMRNDKTMHRKLWEWSAISQALEERGFLTPSHKGIGFAVGLEPLASLFASRGVELLASDFSFGSANSDSWESSGQLAVSLQNIYWSGIVDSKQFESRVKYQNIDMRDLTTLPHSYFDFSWSSCSFEHLGSLEAGLEFLVNSLRCLKPGGIAVHTTEFNISSNDDTIDVGDNVIYRKKDIESFDLRLRQLGCAIEALDFNAGFNEADLAFDYPPYYTHGRQHIKLKIADYISTSMILIIRKAI
jgi:SAM-dependent methyltransferase